VGSMLLILGFLCCPIMCHYDLISMFDVRYDFRIKPMFGSSLPPVVACRGFIYIVITLCICVCLRIVVSNTYCVVFLF